MDNTHKLLEAFIKASGYEIEEIPVKYEDVDPEMKGLAGGNEVLRVDYKVTKKKAGLKCGPHKDEEAMTEWLESVQESRERIK